jgi:hypothetical protein
VRKGELCVVAQEMLRRGKSSGRRPPLADWYGGASAEREEE